MANTTDNSQTTVSLSRLLQLTSPMLPVGAYSYSQGLEWAIESGEVHDAASAKKWITAVLTLNQASFDLPILVRLYQAWSEHDSDAVTEWNQFYLAGRDTSESLAETKQMGYSLTRLLNDLPEIDEDFLAMLNSLEPVSFPTVYAGISQQWAIAKRDMLEGYLWAWVENQVSAAMKAVPLGQVAGQKILLEVGAQLADAVTRSEILSDDEISNFTPLLSVAGSLHETQYSRLFRS